VDEVVYFSGTSSIDIGIIRNRERPSDDRPGEYDGAKI
jgi:hypothetical protein